MYMCYKQRNNFIIINRVQSIKFPTHNWSKHFEYKTTFYAFPYDTNETTSGL